MYLKTLFLVCVVQLLIKYSHGQRNPHFYRYDYTYLDATESFYKVHAGYRTWMDARKICANEGGHLFFPEDQNESDAVWSYLNETHPFPSIHVGLSDLLAEDVFETVDGKALYAIPHAWNFKEPNNGLGFKEEDCVEMFRHGHINDVSCETYKLPFICKRTLASIQWNEPCNMAFNDYTYNEQIGRCYKFHTKPIKWSDAQALCAAEQSYLAVINSQQEADYLVTLTAQKHKNKTGNYSKDTVFLGFHNQFDDDWTTVKGTSVEDSGYASWALGQPDEILTSGQLDTPVPDRKCGSMFYNGLLNTISCDEKSFFICEHEISGPATSLVSTTEVYSWTTWTESASEVSETTIEPVYCINCEEMNENAITLITNQQDK